MKKLNMLDSSILHQHAAVIFSLVAGENSSFELILVTKKDLR